MCFLHQTKPNTPDLHPFLKDEWELPKEEFTLEEELGSGYFAHVHRGRWKNLIKVAIKILKNGIFSAHLTRLIEQFLMFEAPQQEEEDFQKEKLLCSRC